MTRSTRIADARRLLRLWASAGLALLIAAAAMQIEHWGAAGTALAVLGLAALLWLVLRYPRLSGANRDRAQKISAAARLLLLGGLAVALAAFAISRSAEQRAQIRSLCEGQSAQMGAWNFSLLRITPVAGEGFTALQASISARQDANPAFTLIPQLRAYFVPLTAVDEASRARQWDGDLALRFAGYETATGCMELAATWRPFAVWVQIGLWLAAFAAAVLTVVAASSLRWRFNARERIAMRREDRPLSGIPTARAKSSLARPLVMILPVGIAAWLAVGSPNPIWPAPAPLASRFDGGAALVAARQSLLDGPANLNRWIVIGDAMARRGNFGDAAEVLLGAVQSTPRDPQGWLALGDALYGHAGGRLSPAALLAYQRADETVLAAGAPPLLVGTAMERSGRGDLALLWWQYRLSQAPRDAIWRSTIEARIAALQSAGAGHTP